MTEFDDAVMMPGSATPVGKDEQDDQECPIATLWLADPSSRSGWSMRHVWRKPDPKSKRQAGFRR